MDSRRKTDHPFFALGSKDRIFMTALAQSRLARSGISQKRGLVDAVMHGQDIRRGFVCKSSNTGHPPGSRMTILAPHFRRRRRNTPGGGQHLARCRIPGCYREERIGIKRTIIRIGHHGNKSGLKGIARMGVLHGSRNHIARNTNIGGQRFFQPKEGLGMIPESDLTGRIFKSRLHGIA